MKNLLGNFFLTLGGADPNILKHARFKHLVKQYQSTGIMVALTALMAFASTTVSLSVITSNLPISLIGGLVVGLIIGNLDYYLTVTFKPRRGESFVSKLIRVAPRAAVSLLFSFVIDIGVKVYLFRPEIERYLAEKNALAQQDQRQRLVNNPERLALESQKTKLEADVNRLDKIINARTGESIGEAEGTSGSGVPGIGILFEQKQAEVERVQLEYKRKQAELVSVDQAIEQNKSRQEAALKGIVSRAPSHSFLTQFSAADVVGKSDPSAQIISWSFFLFILLIDSSPLLLKLQQDVNAYEEYISTLESEEIAKQEALRQHQTHLRTIEREASAKAIPHAIRQRSKVFEDAMTLTTEKMVSHPMYAQVVDETVKKSLDQLKVDLDRAVSRGLIDFGIERVAEAVNTAKKEHKKHVLWNHFQRLYLKFQIKNIGEVPQKTQKRLYIRRTKH
jgi:hypothetical protein